MPEHISKLSLMGSILVAFMLLTAFSPATLSNGSPLLRSNLKIKASTSANWSGYVAESTMSHPTSGFIISVKGNWTIPTITGNSSLNTYVAIWVGIDGYSDGTVEQIGTEQEWVNGLQQNYAWIELYPNPAQIITRITVHKGDSFTASVTYQANNYFTLSITDLTTRQSYSKTLMASALRQSAEWIVEAPSSGSILPLANFSSVTFKNAQFTISNGTTYAINGREAGTYDSIILKDPSGGTATPSGLTNSAYPHGPSSFSVRYGANAPPTSLLLGEGEGGGGYGAGLHLYLLQ